MFRESLLPDEHEFKYGDSGLYHQSPRFDLLHTLPDRSAYCVQYVDTSVIKMPLSLQVGHEFRDADSWVSNSKLPESICLKLSHNDQHSVGYT